MMETSTIEVVIAIDTGVKLEHLEQRILAADRTKYHALCVIEERGLWEGQYKSFEYFLSVICDISSLAWKRMNDRYGTKGSVE